MKYKDYEIEISGSLDGVTCHELNLSADTVPALTKSIDAIVRKQNEAAKVPILFRQWRDQEFKSGIAGAEDRSYADSYRWVTWNDGKKKERAKKSIKELILDTPENREMIAEYLRLVDIAKTAENAASKYLRSIPTLASAGSKKEPD